MADDLENSMEVDASNALLSFKNGGASGDSPNDRSPSTPPHLDSHGHHRGVEATPSTPLNRRGVPARIRKKNRLFFDDDTQVSVVPRSMLKTTRTKTPSKRGRKPRDVPSQPSVPSLPAPSPQSGVNVPFTTIESSDRRLGQRIGLKLRNLLKLPKAHRWVCYEWFYSNIDQVLLGGENDFLVCLKESFPQLKTYNLSRVEWCKMRRLMGKPRRCSQAFFLEERRELERKRQKIRQLQQRKPMDLTTCKDLPAEIPLQLVIGTKVTARLRSPQDGLFLGSVDALDTSNNTYRITFERLGIGTHSIPDCEVLSNEPVETMSVASMLAALRPSTKGGTHADTKPTVPDSSSSNPGGCGFPMATLESIVQLHKILEIKKGKVGELRSMNTEAENRQGFQQRLSEEFTKRYASVVVELEQINTYLHQILASVDKLCQSLVDEDGEKCGEWRGVLTTPAAVRNQALDEARSVVEHCKSSVTSPRLIELVMELTALIIQVRSLSESERSNYEVECLSTSMEYIKKSLSPLNKSLFENLVEVHIRQIQSGLCGDVGPFSGFLSGTVGGYQGSQNMGRSTPHQKIPPL